MTKKAREKLLAEIDAFISDRRRGEGGEWAHPSKEDMTQLENLLWRIIQAKFEGDYKGVIPIQLITNCYTLNERIPYLVEVPRADMASTDDEMFDVLYRFASNVGSVANRHREISEYVRGTREMIKKVKDEQIKSRPD
jgi:hypothetical protein